MIEAGRRKGIGAALATLAAGLLLGAIVYGIFSARASSDATHRLTVAVHAEQARNGAVIAEIHAQDARIEALELELKQLLAAQPNINRALTADIIRQIEALRFSVHQEGARVVIVPRLVPAPTITVRASPSPTPTCRKPHCR
jgi:hypothetical protein